MDADSVKEKAKDALDSEYGEERVDKGHDAATQASEQAAGGEIGEEARKTRGVENAPIDQA